MWQGKGRGLEGRFPLAGGSRNCFFFTVYVEIERGSREGEGGEGTLHR